MVRASPLRGPPWRPPPASHPRTPRAGARIFGIVILSSSPRPPAWRYLVSDPLAGAANMACDQALMSRARRTDEAVLRIYRWAGPTLSLGRNQTARGAYDRHRAAELDVTFVRRPTGGRALLHHREVTYSVAAPESFDSTLHGAYTRINDMLLHALRALGVNATLAEPAGRAPRPGLAREASNPSRASSATKQSSRTTWAVWEARTPSFRSFRPWRMPGLPFSITKAATPADNFIRLYISCLQSC